MSKFRYIAFNKPYQVLCQFSPSDSKKTLKDFGFPPLVYSIGRIDYDSEGLLLLTSDKSLNDLLLNPRNKHERTYLVQVENIPTHESLNQLRKGLNLKDYKTLPCKAEILPDFQEPFPRNPPIRIREKIPTAWLEITVVEGKNRQVRKMVAAIGYPCLRLIRKRINNIHLEDLELKPGEWKDILRSEII